MKITEDKLRAAIQITLGSTGKYNEKEEDDLVNCIKNLSFTDNEKLFSLEDMKKSFDAGDKFRLYLDKNAIGLGNVFENDIPTNEEIFKTMSFGTWIKNKQK